MGGKGGSTQVVERPLTPQELELIEMQTQMMRDINPVMNKLLQSGVDGIEKSSFNPDYNAMYEMADRDMSDYRNDMKDLSKGILPTPYIENKRNYYEQLGNIGMGNILNSASKKGVINSSVTSAGINDLQKNISSQMSNDFTKDMQTQAALLSNRAQGIYEPIKLAATAQSASISKPTQLIGLATGQGSLGNQTLSAIGGLHNDSSAFVQKQGKGLF